jgi:hypothetical protein
LFKITWNVYIVGRDIKSGPAVPFSKSQPYVKENRSDVATPNVGHVSVRVKSYKDILI